MVPLWVTRSRDRVSCHAVALPIVMSPDGHVLVREILVPRTFMLTNAREIEGYLQLGFYATLEGIPCKWGYQ